MARFSDEQKAQAVARVESGDATQVQVAKEVGCSPTTLKKWRKVALSGHEKGFTNRVTEISERIEQAQAETREALLARVADLIPGCDSLKDVATAYGIITDKALLAAGKPTAIHGEAIAVGDGTPEELEATVEELRKRRQRA